MPYVERGVVKSKRSIWRLRTLADFFWAIVNIIGVYFATMFSEEKSDTYRKGKASGKKWDGGGPGGPGSGPSGGGPRGPARGLDNVRGIDHIPFLPVVPAVAEGLEISLSICNGVLNACGVWEIGGYCVQTNSGFPSSAGEKKVVKMVSI
ncbi:unnamed protein product [Camellia sinensis]